MNKMNSNEGKLTALAIALDYAGLSYNDVTVEKLGLAGDMLGIDYEIEFNCGCLKFYCYVDVFDGEVVGFMTVPNDSAIKVSAAA